MLYAIYIKYLEYRTNSEIVDNPNYIILISYKFPNHF